MGARSGVFVASVLVGVLAGCGGSGATPPANTSTGQGVVYAVAVVPTIQGGRAGHFTVTYATSTGTSQATAGPSAWSYIRGSDPGGVAVSAQMSDDSSGAITCIITDIDTGAVLAKNTSTARYGVATCSP